MKIKKVVLTTFAFLLVFAMSYGPGEIGVELQFDVPGAEAQANYGSIYGKIRCMMAAGLERKCDIRGYVSKVEDYLRK